MFFFVKGSAVAVSLQRLFVVCVGGPPQKVDALVRRGLFVTSAEAGNAKVRASENDDGADGATGAGAEAAVGSPSATPPRRALPMAVSVQVESKAF